MYRVEDKYIMSDLDFLLLENKVKELMPLDNNREYKISSLYFDDYYDTDLNDTISGNPNRKKMRIRIYDDNFETIKLEVKYKSYSRVDKKSCNITKDEMFSLINGNPIKWGNKDSPRNLFNEKILSSMLRPKVIVTYERSAYLYKFGNTRITFDKNVRSSRNIEMFGDKNLYYDDIEDNKILEVKYDEFIPDFVSLVLSSDSIRQISFSKYRLCRENYLRGVYE
jgi:hypothetical protein